MTVTDLDSTNGTFVDDREVKALKSAKLKVGSEVVFGCARRPACRNGVLGGAARARARASLGLHWRTSRLHARKPDSVWRPFCLQ